MAEERLPGVDRVERDKLPIEEWWAVVSSDDFQAFVPKWEEYGSNDLKIFGEFLAGMRGWKNLNRAQLIELGCFGYLLGKIARASEAYTDKRFPSDDTFKDFVTYSMMLRRSREGGL